MDPDSTIAPLLLTLFILVAASAFFSMCESAMVTLSDSRLKRLAEDGDNRARKLLDKLDHPSRFLATVQAGVTLCGLFAAGLVCDRFAGAAVKALAGYGIAGPWLHPLAVFLITLVLAFVLLVFGKLLPKRLAASRPEKISFSLIGPYGFFSALLRPFVAAAEGFSGLLLRLLGHSPDEEPEEVTEEEIRMMVDVGEEKGVIEQSEKDMINNIFEFDDRSVAAVMTHRTETTAVEATASLEEIVRVAMETGYSRIPVYEDDLDNIIGIIYAKDLLQFIGSQQEFRIRDCVRPPLFIPESTRCTELFKELKSRKLQMAVIVDEYGGTYGIGTMEDLLESIVGNIQDEYDNEAEEISVQPDGAVTFDGSVSLEEAERQLGIQFEDDVDSETLSGVLTDKLGRIPKMGEHPQVTIQNTLFTVVEMDGRRISKVRAETLSSKKESQPE